jgi:hypothetical protein
MFDTYRRKESETVEALKQDKEFTIGGQPFAAGDYLVRNGNELTGASAADFEAVFEKTKKTWSRKKKDADEGAQAPTANEAAA